MATDQHQRVLCRADRAAAKVRELRSELLAVAVDADRKLGEESGARAVAEKEAAEAKKQLGRSMQKYHEKEKRVAEVPVVMASLHC